MGDVGQKKANGACLFRGERVFRSFSSIRLGPRLQSSIIILVISIHDPDSVLVTRGCFSATTSATKNVEEVSCRGVTAGDLETPSCKRQSVIIVELCSEDLANQVRLSVDYREAIRKRDWAPGRFLSPAAGEFLSGNVIFFMFPSVILLVLNGTCCQGCLLGGQVVWWGPWTRSLLMRLGRRLTAMYSTVVATPHLFCVVRRLLAPSHVFLCSLALGAWTSPYAGGVYRLVKVLTALSIFEEKSNKSMFMFRSPLAAFQPL